MLIEFTKGSDNMNENKTNIINRSRGIFGNIATNPYKSMIL